MGLSVHYWAVPPSSALFNRLQNDKAFVTLMAVLFCYGGGAFFFFDDLDSTEREKILESVIDTRQRKLGRGPKARRLIEEFRLELERTRLAYPGVEHRKCSLEKTSFVVEERLSEALKLVRRDAMEFVKRLMWGDQSLGRDGALDLEGDFENAMMDMEDSLGLVSPALVREGALVLREVDAVNAFFRDRVWEFESFRRWRRLYQDAAAQGEALLVGVC
jgi:hypothetical protein